MRSFALVGEWDAHESIVLSSEVVGGEGRGLLLTGGNDASLKVRRSFIPSGPEA